MAWTTPITWTTAQLVTAAQFNTHIRDNENWLNTMHGCRVWKANTQVVTNGNTDVVSFDSEDFDSDLLHDTSVNNSRITIPTGLGGKWGFTFTTTCDADAADSRRYGLSLRKNAAGASGGGTFLLSMSGQGISGGVHSFAIPFYVCVLNAADYVEAFFNSVTEDRALQNGTDATSFQAVYLGV